MSTVKRRRDEYSEATREGLIDSATRLFAERGYTGTSLDEIAAAARVTKGALYYHFRGKQAIFEAVLERIETAIARSTAAQATGDAWDDALASLDMYLAHCADPVHGRIVMREGPIALGWERWLELEREFTSGVIEGVLQRLIDEGYVAPVPIDSSVTLLFGMFGAAAHALADAPEADKPRLISEFRTLIIDFAMGFRARGPREA